MLLHENIIRDKRWALYYAFAFETTCSDPRKYFREIFAPQYQDESSSTPRPCDASAFLYGRPQPSMCTLHEINNSETGLEECSMDARKRFKPVSGKTV